MSITLNGTVPVSATPTLILESTGKTGPAGLLKFKFSAPQAGAYEMAFCIGPASNPCGTSGSVVTSVPGGQERLALVDAAIFRNSVLVVSQGTSTVLPFAVTIE